MSLLDLVTPFNDDSQCDNLLCYLFVCLFASSSPKCTINILSRILKVYIYKNPCKKNKYITNSE